MKKIAKQLNVSISVVFRASHNGHSIGLITTIKPRELAKELDDKFNKMTIFFQQCKRLHQL